MRKLESPDSLFWCYICNNGWLDQRQGSESATRKSIIDQEYWISDLKKFATKIFRKNMKPYLLKILWELMN